MRTLQEVFNRAKLHERIRAGELREILVKSSHPSPPRSGNPDCTRSQILIYATLDGKPVALVHQYMRPDGTLGGSGKPDPKMLVVAGETLFVKSGS